MGGCYRGVARDTLIPACADVVNVTAQALLDILEKP
jgi:hypothetical protein